MRHGARLPLPRLHVVSDGSRQVADAGGVRIPAPVPSARPVPHQGGSLAAAKPLGRAARWPRGSHLAHGLPADPPGRPARHWHPRVHSGRALRAWDTPVRERQDCPGRQAEGPLAASVGRARSVLAVWSSLSLSPAPGGRGARGRSPFHPSGIFEMRPLRNQSTQRKKKRRAPNRSALRFAHKTAAGLYRTVHCLLDSAATNMWLETTCYPPISEKSNIRSGCASVFKT